LLFELTAPRFPLFGSISCVGRQ